MNDPVIECGWCGGRMMPIEAAEGRSVEVMWGDFEGRVEQYKLTFCCEGCHWAYLLDQHRLIGMGAKEARKHIAGPDHGAVAEEAGGKQSREAWNRSGRFAESFRKAAGMEGWRARGYDEPAASEEELREFAEDLQRSRVGDPWVAG